ncbi:MULTISPECIES: phosphoketolase [Arthrobacter]|uniref:Phosphoketolase n=1 Tax=Arthrobacter terricola TaxID=2547396 RepID=A0A4R5KBA9_9MICC|nr:MULTISPECIES: phosphoketolase [Arthrobacter]MBT8162995.1 hypothetical protein [Arthrobacter sp. GN70]TDF91798.1 phosphoketolase [Arthrobacter terricola]
MSESGVSWAVETLSAVNIDSVSAWQRAMDFLCVAQLYLDVVDPTLPIERDHVKARPAGHWGVCPNMNAVLAVLAHLKPAEAEGQLTVVHGAGHAGASVRADRFLDGSLGLVDRDYEHGVGGMTRLARGFSSDDRWGHEISPLLPRVMYMGGHLGGALGHAQGVALDRPDHLVVPIIGDGECETGTTAGAWLGAHALHGTGSHGHVLPVILLNHQRMGGASVLAGMGRERVVDYLMGVGWEPVWVDGTQPGSLLAGMTRALDRTKPLGNEGQVCIVLDMVKGWGGPTHDSEGQMLIGTPRVHKAPLLDPRRNPAELELLSQWVSSYRPGDLFVEGRPDFVPDNLRRVAFGDPCHSDEVPTKSWSPLSTGGFAEAVQGALTFKDSSCRVFSPDELSSNRISAAALPTKVPEILNEELCHLWLQGYLTSGRRGIAIEYESFASIALPLIRQYAKSRALARQSNGGGSVPTMTYLLTSLCWNNSYSHQDPAVVLGMAESAPVPVRLLTPADPVRLAAVIRQCVSSNDSIAVITASKYATENFPRDTLDEELRTGMAVWPTLSDPGTPDITLCVAGDVASSVAAQALSAFRETAPGKKVRWVTLLDLNALDPKMRGPWPARFEKVFPDHGPVLFVVPYFAAAVKSRLFDIPQMASRSTVLGFQDLGHHLKGEALLDACGMSPDRLCQLMLTSTQEPVADRRLRDQDHLSTGAIHR